MKSCFFVGHADASEKIFPDLVSAIEQHIVVYGVTDFTVGNYGSFDRMAARGVIDAKKTHPQISLSMLIPYHPAERAIVLPSGFDALFYPPQMECVPRRFAIVHANNYMIAHADYLIAYAPYPGNARKLLEKAKNRKNIQVTVLPGE